MLFKDVLVDEKIKNRLILSVKDNKISHGQLFVGNEGSHKLALALAYAQYINCENKQDNDSCGVCPSCRQMSKLQHPDLYLVFPHPARDKNSKVMDYKQFSTQFSELLMQSDYTLGLNSWMEFLETENKQPLINIQDCNYIVHQNNIKSYQGGYKIFIIWQADRLYYDAAPKLLKTLEEPQENTLFILITEHQDALLKTILSRVQTIRIPKITKSVLSHRLRETLNLTEDKLEEILMFSDGNYTKARNFGSLSNINYDLFLQWMRAAYRTHFMSQNLNNLNFEVTTELILKIANMEREQQKQLVIYFLKSIEYILYINNGMSDKVLLSDNIKESLKKMGQFINIKTATLISCELEKAIYHIERNANANILYTDLMFKIAKIIGQYQSNN